MRKNREEEPEAELRKNIKNMSFPQKLEYFWMYDKWVLIVAVIVIAAAVGGYRWYQNLKVKTVLTIAPVNGSMMDADAMSEEIKEVLGATGAYEEVDLLTNYTVDLESGVLDYYSQMGFVAQIQAKMLDVLIMPESMMKEQGEDTFLPMEEVLGEDAQKYKDEIAYHCLVLEDPELAEAFALSYEPICIGVLVNSQHVDQAAVWIRSVLD